MSNDHDPFVSEFLRRRFAIMVLVCSVFHEPCNCSYLQSFPVHDDAAPTAIYPSSSLDAAEDSWFVSLMTRWCQVSQPVNSRISPVQINRGSSFRRLLSSDRNGSLSGSGGGEPGSETILLT